MKLLIRRLIRGESGQDLIEYALLVSFLALVSVLTLLTVNTPWVQQRRGKLLTLNVILGVGIILMSTMLRRSY